MNPYSLESYQYPLPEELIAQYPASPRDSSRLLLVDRKSQSFKEMIFRDLQDFLQPSDTLIFNDTKVIPAKLLGRRETGGKSELLLIRNRGDCWEALGKNIPPGARITFSDTFYCDILEALPDGHRLIRFNDDSLLPLHGEMPLPPYIHRSEEDPSRYQTVYAKQAGAIAAPTAGLHFTDQLLESLKQKGIDEIYLTLHVGLGTFKPVQTDDIRDHRMHSERVIISPETANRLNQKKGRRIVVGTTCCRALESACQDKIIPGDFETNIFIYPGYRFRYVEHLLTNFHLPGSTLLMLVSAFGGYELIREAYAYAVKERFRFFSYGDAMLIL